MRRLTFNVRPFLSSPSARSSCYEYLHSCGMGREDCQAIERLATALPKINVPDGAWLAIHWTNASLIGVHSNLAHSVVPANLAGWQASDDDIGLIFRRDPAGHDDGR